MPCNFYTCAGVIASERRNLIREKKTLNSLLFKSAWAPDSIPQYNCLSFPFLSRNQTNQTKSRASAAAGISITLSW